MFVKPAEGRMPRDPHTNLRVPPEGQHAPPYDQHWALLLQFGDVIECDEPKASPPPCDKPSAAPAPRDPQ
jgi:hypothetical protein